MLPMTTLYPASLVERFWTKVQICAHGVACDACCWEWQGARHPTGYGNFYLTRAAGKKVYTKAHILAWELHQNSFLSLDLCVLHTCDNPPCCSYHHVFAGTHQDNMEDMRRKGREARGATHGTRTKPESIGRGERNAMAKLTEAQVLELRALAVTGAYTRAELAQRYHVDGNTVTMAVRGKNWTYLPGAVQPQWRHVIRQRGTDGKFLSLPQAPR